MMRVALFALSSLCAGLFVAASAQAETYYDPSNVGSPTGVTVGSELYRTIGCPGKALLDPSCKEEQKPAPVVVVEPAPAPAPAPAPVVVVEPAPAPAPAPVQASAPEYVNPFAFCFIKH
ncbi:hypothetical protein [Parasulfuritortus cantonensis]|uniref:hypothetical protein n=1 Tax=Parasulfuritortus cantonensis TaxID=2528202 RepID=UPI001981F962|nr:hypothetical protein [Parasulfuritortus cantonensis]